LITAFAFYLFAIVTVLAATMVIFAKNPVHSVLWLILAFFSAAGLFVLMGAEFLAMILVIVYVGAVAVLFLFVVMMLDIDFEALRKGFLSYLPFGLLLGVVLLVELLVLGTAWQSADNAVALSRAPADGAVENSRALGRLLYTHYVYVFQASGLILLVAMIGAIVLTHRQRSGVKRQDIGRQVARTPEAAFGTVKVVSGEGISL
jgi:NADH-quinone oxidoreductase subunit J